MADVRFLLMHRKVLTATALHYHKQLMSLPSSHQSWEYLKSRGITRQTVKKNMLGYSHGEGLFEALTAEGYLRSVLFAKNVVIVTKKEDNRVVDFFGKGRIIFPCLREGRVLGMTSRICYETSDKTIPRYKVLGKNSYHFYAPDFVAKGKPLFIVEGPVDVLVLLQLGFNAVCFFGTSGFNDEYVADLDGISALYCIPDTENNKQARLANMNMYINMAMKLGIMPRIVELPLGEKESKTDPADFFSGMKKHVAKEVMTTYCDMSRRLDSTEEWNNHLRKLREDQRMKELKTQTIKEGNALEKFPILDTLELLGIKVLTSFGRPICGCFNPDHEDTKPSVQIYTDTQTFHCFGCGAGHDAIDAVRMIRNCSFQEAVDWLKESL